MEQKWFYRVGSLEFGPVPFQTLLRKVESKELSVDDFVRLETDQQWTRIQSDTRFRTIRNRTPSQSEQPNQLEENTDQKQTDDEELIDVGSAELSAQNHLFRPSDSDYLQVATGSASIENSKKSSIWFCRVLGTEFGPLSHREITTMIRGDVLSPNDDVRYGIDGVWLKGVEFSELASEFQKHRGSVKAREAPLEEVRPPKKADDHSDRTKISEDNLTVTVHPGKYESGEEKSIHSARKVQVISRPAMVRSDETSVEFSMIICVISFLIIVPLFISGPIPDHTSLTLGWPRIHSGEEPHRLLQLSSIIQDGDLDLKNNYSASHAGGYDAGRSFAKQPLDHHVTWKRGDRLVRWGEVYEVDRNKWIVEPDGTVVPVKRDPRLSPQFFPEKEYSQHEPGLAILLAPLTFLLRGSAGLESVVLVFSAICVIVSIYFFDLLIREYVVNQTDRFVIAVALYLATPIWHYARTFYPEPYLLVLALGAYAFLLRYSIYLVPGILLSVGMFIAPLFCVLSIPLIVRVIWESDPDLRMSNVARLVTPLVVTALILFVMNNSLRDQYSIFADPWVSGNIFEGAIGQLFSPRHGIFLVAPITVVSIMCWWRFMAEETSDALTILSGFLLYFFCVSLKPDWWGGFCYGPRLIVPVLPFLFVSLAYFRKVFRVNSIVVQMCCMAILMESILFSIVAAVGCGYSLDHHPFEMIVSFANWI